MIFQYYFHVFLFVFWTKSSALGYPYCIFNLDYIKFYTGPLTSWLECLPMARETRVQSQLESYQKLKKMVLDVSLLDTQHYKGTSQG